MTVITNARIYDARFDLPDGAGSDAVHINPQYGYAVAVLETNDGRQGTGITYTLGGGTNLICEAVKLYAPLVVGRPVDELMAEFGAVQKQMVDHHQLRWLGPHKGVTHAAISAVTNACFDLWARTKGVPLWRLLLDLSPQQLVELVDFSYLEDVLTKDEARRILEDRLASREQRCGVLREGYPGYDTSAGWFQYSEEKLRENVRRAMEAGFTAVKLKVGSRDPERDIRRATLVRELVGSRLTIMLDANQAWSLPAAMKNGRSLAAIEPYWLEEPTHPDDILGHQELARELAPVRVAVGEAVPNRVVWKNYLRAGAVGVVQADCTRLAGISEYLAVAILATKYPVQVIPHVGDMGQIHQHLVWFNHIALGHAKLFLEYIPHLRDYFTEPAVVAEGRYQTPDRPGCSTGMRLNVMKYVGCIEAER